MFTTRFSFRKWVNLTLAVLAMATLLASSCTPVKASQLQPFARGLARQIERTYGIVLADRGARWTADEAYTIWRALERLSGRITVVFGQNGEPLVKALMEGFVFYRDAGSGDKIAYTIAGTVSFYDVWASYDEARRMFYLYHEMGHLLDTRSSLMNLFMGEISGQFSGRVGAYVDEGGRYQLGAYFPQPSAGQTVRHRTDGASEDWAETFASVLMPEFENDLRNVGDARLYEVRDQFVHFLASRHHDQRAGELLAANE